MIKEITRAAKGGILIRPGGAELKLGERES
jgi:hypothetical protein